GRRLGSLRRSVREVSAMPNFEVFTRRMVPMTKQPSVTIQKRGTISLNRAAQVALGEPEAIELLFDRREQVVGIRALDPGEQHAYPLRPQGKKNAGTYLIAGTAFTRYYGIDTEVSRRWVATIEDGVLCVDLKKEGAIVTSNRKGHGSPEDSTV